MFDLCSLNYFAHVPVNGIAESGELLGHRKEITPSLDTSWGAREETFSDFEYGRQESHSMELTTARPCSLRTWEAGTVCCRMWLMAGIKFGGKDLLARRPWVPGVSVITHFHFSSLWNSLFWVIKMLTILFYTSAKPGFFHLKALWSFLQNWL